MGFTVAANALKDDQRWFRNAFPCLFPECQLKACVCGWHVGACWSMLGERALAEGGLHVCLWLPGCHLCGTVTLPAITNLSLHLAACETAALHVTQCRKNQQSFSKPAHKHPSHPGGPAWRVKDQVWEAEGTGNTGQDLRDALGMSVLLTGPNALTVIPSLILKGCKGWWKQKGRFACGSMSPMSPRCSCSCQWGWQLTYPLVFGGKVVFCYVKK